MPVSTLTCPKCGAVLKPAKPVEAGKKIKCPKCSTIFEAREEGVTRAPTKAPPSKAAPTKGVPARTKPDAVTKKPAAPKPAAPKKHYQDDADDGPETYAFVKDPEEERRKHDDDDYDDDEDDSDDRSPKIDYVPDMSIKDLRGPAQIRLNSPSNWLMITGILGCVTCLVNIGWAAFPMIFTEYQPQPSEVLKVFDPKAYPPNMPDKELKDLTAKERDIYDDVVTAFLVLRVISICVAVVFFVYNALIAHGAVKMQNMESYRWGMAAAIMAMVPLSTCWLPLGLPVGIWALTTLRKPEVIAGFEYKPD